MVVVVYYVSDLMIDILVMVFEFDFVEGYVEFFWFDLMCLVVVFKVDIVEVVIVCFIVNGCVIGVNGMMFQVVNFVFGLVLVVYVVIVMIIVIWVVVVGIVVI